VARRGEDKDKQHQQSLCGMCKELGHPCMKVREIKKSAALPSDKGISSVEPPGEKKELKKKRRYEAICQNSGDNFTPIINLFLYLSERYRKRGGKGKGGPDKGQPGAVSSPGNSDPVYADLMAKLGAIQIKA